jgi:hypothetical protein
MKKFTKAQVNKVKKLSAMIDVPKDFEKESDIPEVGKEYPESFETPKIILKNEEVQVEFFITFYKGNLDVIGTTNYKYNGSWYTFDRRGVENSFYMTTADESKVNYFVCGELITEESVNKMVEVQIAKCKEAVERLSNTLVVPQFGHHVTEERRKEIATKLKKGGCHTFAPSGFGTAHVVSMKRTRWSKPVKKEVSEFFGINAKLFCVDQDWD